jgi:hypothetical protein
MDFVAVMVMGTCIAGLPTSVMDIENVEVVKMVDVMEA